MTATITIDPGGSSETIIPPSDIERVSGVKIHTGLSNWNAEVTYNTDLESLRGSTVWIEDSSTDYFYRGFLLRTEDEETPGSAVTRISGQGVELDLDRNGNEKTYTNTLVSTAISDYWSNETNFNATVTTHSADSTTTDTQIQEADTNAEFTAITSTNLSDTDPVVVRNTNLESAQTCFFIEAEAASDDSSTDGFSGTGGIIAAIDEYSEGAGYELEAVGEEARWRVQDVTLDAGQDLDGVDYTIPADNVELAVRHGRSGPRDVPAVEWYVNGDFVGATGDETGIGDVWSKAGIDGPISFGEDGTGDAPGYTGGDITSSTVDIRAVVVANAGANDYNIDGLALYDNRFHDADDFDNTLDANQGNLDGPEQYPISDGTYEDNELELDLAPSTWRVTSASVTSSWDDTSNGQRIRLKLDPDGSYGPTNGDEDNTTSITDFAFGSDEGTAVRAKVRFSNYGSRSGTTPKSGFNGQVLQDWTLTIDGNDVPVITDKTYQGSDLEILQELHSEGRMRYTVTHSKNNKNVDSYPVGSIVKSQPDWTVISTKRVHDIGSRYSNHITVRGQRDTDGNRLKTTISDSDGITEFGQIHWDEKRPDAETQTEVERIARQILKRHLQESDVTAVREIPSIDIQPGYSYPVTGPDGTTTDVASEEVHYRVQQGDVTGRVLFNVNARELQERLNDIDTGLRGTQLAF